MRPGVVEAGRRVAKALEDGQTALDLSNLGLDSVPPGLTELKSMTTLDLNGNRLAALPRWLGNLPSLTDLDLDDNRFEVVPLELAELGQLKSLAMSGNRITEVPVWLADLAGLTSLSLGRNRLTSLPAQLAELDGLTELDLGRNRLRDLPEWLGSYPGIRELYLDKLLLASVPGWLANLTTLTRLDLDYNQLSALPDWLGGFSLQHIDLEGNKFSVLPSWLTELSDLTVLYLAHNQFSTLPPWLGCLSGLVTLGLNDNQLTTLPPSMAELTELSELLLDRNKLAPLPNWLGELTNLKKLGIGSNSLTTLPDSLAELTRLTTLWLSNNELTALPAWLGSLTELTWLDLDRNQLANVDALGSLTKLTRLNLNHNQLKFQPDSLTSLTKLSRVYLANNQLAEVPEWLSHLPELTELGVGGNGLTALPSWLGSRAELTTLGLGRNKLAKLPEWLGTLTNLTRLDLDGNEIAALPDRLGSLTKLSHLRLSENLLVSLPDWLGTLTELTSLNLDRNQLTELPDSLAGLTGLTSLQLSDNKFTVLPEWLGEFTGMVALYLDGCELDTVPEWLANLSGIETLALDNNLLTAVPIWLGNLTKLSYLWLSVNHIDTLPDSLCNLTKLSFLTVSKNRLTSLPERTGDLVGLTHLLAYDNQISILPDNLNRLSELVNLDLDGNQLTVLPETLGELPSLTHLLISDNKIAVLPSCLTNLAKLETLAVEGNPLVSPPPEIAASGSTPVISFLRAREEGSSAQWVSKLLVVGEGGVGKTSLVKALAGEPYDPDELSTHGLRIEHLDLDHPSQPVQMRLSAWDFGGQEIYHATHQFFLTNRSLFLLLWNSRLGWEQGKIRYWLDIISARAPESPILLVATHVHDRPVDLPLDELRYEYPMIVDSVSVDNATRHALDDLRTRLACQAAQLPLMGSEWPTTWLAGAEALRQATEKHVTPARMWRMLAEAGVSDKSHQQYIANALHQLGDILYYADDPELAQTVVLRPEWVNEYISKVLDSHEVAVAQGLLTRDHLDELWSDLDDRGLRDHFLGMMDKYDLSYQIEGGTTGDVSLVVERLPWDPGSFLDKWDELPGDQEIRVLYRLNTMPPGIPTWFIARTHRFSTQTQWRTGAVLKHTDGRHRALIRANRHRNTVELAVRGPSPAAFFSILDDGLNRTLERFPGLDITRQVPCPCQNASDEPCAELYDYRDLHRRLERTPPRHEIECRKSGEYVDVPSLLLGLAPSDRDATRIGLQRIAKTLEQMDGKLAEQTEYTQRMFLKLQRLAQLQQETRCPSVFAIVPAGHRRLGSAQYELRLYCEEPGSWHRLPEEDGCYAISQPAEWLRKFGPYLQHLLKVLKHAAPLAGPVLGMSVDVLDQHLKSDCDLMKELVAQTPSQLRHDDELDGIDPSGLPAARATNDADFRALEAMLTGLDAERIWGGLSRTATPEGLTLYLCADHVTAYRRV
ncbi:leucine-rich repeat domain-containing protein [Amycolatopsis sp. NPDC051071]|uniref:leucine-rich repeat domain-containing protein n=1 Tax=Amycolatopsis sp. NPDC051071 TaxID=3154637 RepID=UPI003423F6AF